MRLARPTHQQRSARKGRSGSASWLCLQRTRGPGDSDQGPEQSTTHERYRDRRVGCASGSSTPSGARRSVSEGCYSMWSGTRPTTRGRWGESERGTGAPVALWPAALRPLYGRWAGRRVILKYFSAIAAIFSLKQLPNHPQQHLMGCGADRSLPSASRTPLCSTLHPSPGTPQLLAVQQV